MSLARANILGVGVSAIDMRIATQTIDDWIRRREQHYVCVTPVSSVMACQFEPSLLPIYNNSGLTTPDGMPIVWLCRLMGFRRVERVYGPDLMLAAFERSAARGYRHFLYGGEEGVADALAMSLRQRFKGVGVVGTYTPPFRPLTPVEDAALMQQIEVAQPDIVWVGLSSPKQDRWMAEHLGRVAAPVMIGVGAAFNFHSGRVKQAPRWMQRSGLEWAFRLYQEPRRLWKRYLLYNPTFLLLVALQLAGLRRYPLSS